MRLPGKAFCGDIMKASRDFSSQTMFEFCMTLLYRNPGTDPACLPMIPDMPGPMPFVLSLAWQIAHFLNARSPCAELPGSAEMLGATGNAATIAMMANESRGRMINPA